MERDSNKNEVIKQLQKLSEEVLELKSTYRQKRPIVIEFSGSPKAGKTSSINSLELFLKRNGFSVQIVQERASVCPVTDKQSPMFNIWTACTSLAGLVGILENKKNHVDVLILDRGIFDSLCWFEWLVSTSKMEEKQREILEQFLLMDEFVKCIDIVFAFCVDSDISIEREYATLLTDKPGTIMNKKVLDEYFNSIEQTVEQKKSFFHKVFMINTSNKNQDEVGKEVTTITLKTLKALLMERIGYFKKNKKMDAILSNGGYIEYEALKNILPKRLHFDSREIVENNKKLLQPVPVAIITNKDRTKVLAVKKNKKATSDNSPEKDKTLLYVGGHTRSEDYIESKEEDFLSVCRITLKREVKEEIGISIALDNVEPFYLYSLKNDKSKQHLAVCFLVSIDDEGLKLRIDQQELVLNKGKSKSGKFWSLEELEDINDFEEWSNLILKECFNISKRQMEISDFL